MVLENLSRQARWLLDRSHAREFAAQISTHHLQLIHRMSPYKRTLLALAVIWQLSELVVFPQGKDVASYGKYPSCAVQSIR